jgi:hypothetical protein
MRLSGAETCTKKARESPRRQSKQQIDAMWADNTASRVLEAERVAVVSACGIKGKVGW